MANLIIDIGNTAVKACLAEGTTLGKTFRYQGEKGIDFIHSLAVKEKPQVMVISSVFVIPDSEGRRLSAVCGRLVILDPSRKDILREKELPDHLSYDRAASVMAARYLFKGKGCTVVDFGTTLTVDFTDEDGRYAGGNVSLGCRTRFKALNRYSRTLPLVDTPEETPVIGSSFRTAITSGVVSGIMFEIEGYIGLNPGNVVVFTGGDAIYFAKRMKKSIFVVCNLVLMGLALIADQYVESR